MTSIIPFEFEAMPVRVVEIDGEPWFVAKDVTTALGYTNPQKAVRDHCKRAKSVGVNETFTPLELDPQTVIVPESDIYRLIMRSRLPAAERFETMVVEEVLPSIRRTGHYSVQPLRDPALIAIQQLLFDSQALKDRVEKVETEQAAIRQKLSEYDGDTGYMTVTAFCRANGMCLPVSNANAFGRKAARLCRRRGLPVGSIPDERFGRVNSYPVCILQELAA